MFPISYSAASFWQHGVRQLTALAKRDHRSSDIDTAIQGAILHACLDFLTMEPRDHAIASVVRHHHRCDAYHDLDAVLKEIDLALMDISTVDPACPQTSRQIPRTCCDKILLFGRGTISMDWRNIASCTRKQLNGKGWYENYRVFSFNLAIQYFY